MSLGKHTIAFFWVGENVNIPQTLVQSVRLVMGNEVNLIQLTNKKTQEVRGVNNVHRFDLSSQIMIARLEAYAQYEPESEFTFFCDADCIFINKLKIPTQSNNNIFLSPRVKDFKINHNYPEYYKEFLNKTANEVMPFLFCAITTRGNQQFFFKSLLKTCKELPERFHRWYGDQYALFLKTEGKLKDFETLDPNIYQHEIKEILTLNHLQKIHMNGVQMLHFKGPKSKELTGQALALLKYYLKIQN